MATVKLTLHKSKMFKDGTYPLVFQILHNRQKKIIYTKYRVKGENLNFAKGKVHAVEGGILSKRKAALINRDVKQQHLLIMDKIAKLEYLHIDYSVKDLDDKASACHRLYLMQYINTQINNRLIEKKDGTASAYRNTMMSLKKFLKSKDVKISDVTPVFARKYESYLISNSVCPNTRSYYMRNLKTLFNGIIYDFHCMEENPFKITKTTISKTAKRALSREELIRLIDLEFDLKTESHLDFARDMFMFSFYSRGMSLVDIIYFKKSQIINNVIIYNRKKSKQQIKMTITDRLQAVISKYENNSDYLFPILDVDSTRTLYDQYRLALGRINHNLKTVGERAKLSVPLTSYMARHSWATQAKEVGTPIAMISEGLGHTSEKITQIYLKEFDTSVIDQINEVVTNLK